MFASASGFSSTLEKSGGGSAPERLLGYAEIAFALAEVAQASSVRREISEALGIEAASPADLYELFVKELPPFASIYLSSDGNIGGEIQSVIAGFYHVLGVSTPSDPDHLSSLLALLAGVLSKEAELTGDGGAKGDGMRLSSVRRSKSVLIAEHLMSWLPAYLLRAKEVAPAELLGWVSCAMDLVSAVCEPEPAAVLSEESEPPAAMASVAELVKWMTTPSCSGLILCPSDISSMAGSLGLALRVGRKRFVLEELASQADPSQLLSLFVVAAHRQEELFELYSAEFSLLRSWVARAKRSREILSSAELMARIAK